MLISVILPTYNVKDYIEECVGSLIGQTYKDVEILIVNDGSTDGTAELCDEIARQDSRIRVFHKENGGTHTARNMGIREAKGDYIMFLDPDDWLDTDTFSQLVPLLEEHQLDVVRFGYVREFGNHSALKPNTFLPEDVCIGEDCRKICRQTIGLIGEELVHPENMNFLASACFCLYRRSVITENRLELPNIHEIATFSDGLFNIRFLRKAKRFLYVDKPFYHYRKTNTASASVNYRKDFLERQLHLLEMIRQIAEDEKDAAFIEAYRSRVIYNTLELCLNALVGTRSEKEKYAEVRQILNSPEHRRCFKKVNLGGYPLVWRVYFLFAKLHWTIPVFVMTKIIQFIQKRG